MNEQQQFGLIKRAGIRLQAHGQTSFLTYPSAHERDQSLLKMPFHEGQTRTPCDLWGGDRYQSGHKAFDRQTELITTGNVWGTTQFSHYIRATDECDCNGHRFNKGTLFRKDVEVLMGAVGGGVFKDLLPLGDPDGAGFPGGWGYLFRYFDRGCPVFIGALVTDRHGALLRRIDREDVGERFSHKARQALDLCELLVTDRRVVKNH